MQFTTFKVCEATMGIDIHLVKEIGKISEITKVPEAPSFIAGLINLRGQILTIIHADKVFEMQEEKSVYDKNVKKTLIVIKNNHQLENLYRKKVTKDKIQLGNESFGILVQKVGNIVEAEETELMATPPHVFENSQELITGVIDKNGDLISVLNLEAFTKRLLNKKGN